MSHMYSMGTGLAIVPTTKVVDHLAEGSLAGKLCDLTSPSSDRSVHNPKQVPTHIDITEVKFSLTCVVQSCLLLLQCVDLDVCLYYDHLEPDLQV